jgi:hypothetical protein
MFNFKKDPYYAFKSQAIQFFFTGGSGFIDRIFFYASTQNIGYSSLGYLLYFNVEICLLDGSFVPGSFLDPLQVNGPGSFFFVSNLDSCHIHRSGVGGFIGCSTDLGLHFQSEAGALYIPGIPKTLRAREDHYKIRSSSRCLLSMPAGIPGESLPRHPEEILLRREQWIGKLLTLECMILSGNS